MIKPKTLPENVLRLQFDSAEKAIESFRYVRKKCDSIKNSLEKKFSFSFFKKRKVLSELKKLDNLFELGDNLINEHTLAQETKDTARLTKLVLSYVIMLAEYKNSLLTIFEYNCIRNSFSKFESQLSWINATSGLPVPEIKSIGK